MREPRFDILFEPVKIGPVTARNRFFQVPHCNGMGWLHPSGHAAMRGTKAEGGWAVVCTEEVEFHHSAEHAPYIEGRIWEDADIPAHARLVEKVHEHGSLAGIELVHGGMMAPNLYSRESPMGPGHLAVAGNDPGPGPADEPLGHRRPAPLAPPGGGALAAGGLRPGLRLRRPRPHHHPALPLAPHQRPRRRVRRVGVTPRAPPPRDPRGHARRGRWARGGRLPHLRGRAHRRGRHPARRDLRGARTRRRAARPVGLHGGRLGLRLAHVAVRRGGLAGAVRARA